MKDTQLQAYESIKSVLGKRQKQVFESICENPKTAYDLSNSLNLPINSISGRITELAKLGIIYDSGERKINSFSGKKCVLWKKSENIDSIFLN